MRQALAIDDVHTVLTGSSLRTPVLWRLASNSDIQDMMAGATPDELANPLLQFHLGIRLLSERRYTAAAEAFSVVGADVEARPYPNMRDNAFVLSIYALCMSGQTRKAQQLTRAAWESSGAAPDAPLPPLWAWMKDTFGIDPKDR